MRVLLWPVLGTAAALSLAGCSNQYFERKDTVTFSAGDGVAWNNVQMTADPMPRYAFDTNIRTPGETAARAGNMYATGRSKWYIDPGSRDEPREILNASGASDPDYHAGRGGPSPAEAAGGAAAGAAGATAR